MRQLLDRSARQQSILRGAAAAFGRSGFAATSMEDVAAACGVTKLIIYRHFESKEELYRAVLQRVFDRHAEVFVDGLVTAARRGVGARSFLAVAREDPDGFVLLWRHAAREPQFAGYAREHRRLAVKAAAAMLAVDTADAAVAGWLPEAIVDWLVGAVLSWIEVGDPERDDEAIELMTVALVAMKESWHAHPLLGADQ